MKAKKLIKELKKLVDEHGNLPVNMFENDDATTVSKIHAYDKDGRVPSEYKSPIVEFFLWGE